MLPQRFEDYLKDLDKKIDTAYLQACRMSNPSSYAGVVKDLHDLLDNNRHMFKNYQCIKVYGSRLSGLATPESDIDCFVQMNNNYASQTLSNDEIKSAIQNIGHLMRQSDKFDSINEIPNARIPIVRAIHVGTKTKVDISSTDGIGLETTEILKHYLDLHEKEARKFALFIRNWFDMSIFKLPFMHKILDMLVIFYMQHHHLLPSLYDVKEFAEVSDMVNGIEAAFRKVKQAQELLMDPIDFFTDDLKDFFAFYAKFDFGKNIVCPYVGDSSPALTRSNIYQHKLMQKHHEELKRVDWTKPMIVLGFLKFDSNFATQMTSEQVILFKEYCSNSYNLLDKHGY